MTGRARDLVTPDANGAACVVGEDSFVADLTPQRQITEIAMEPPRAGAQKLVGARAGSQLRAAIAVAMPLELEQGTPLYLLLDDIAGASLVSIWAWSQWHQKWDLSVTRGPGAAELRRKMEGVCIGFAPDSPVMIGSDNDRIENPRLVEPLDNGADPLAWHIMPPTNGFAGDGPVARRARRIDVHVEDEKVVVSSHFQDSSSRPDGQRMAVHEYLLSATVNRHTMLIETIAADPRVLPFAYCPAATLNIGRMIGKPVGDLRKTVVAELAKAEGCTHLNDMLRSLAEVPQMLASLTAAKTRSG
jgi:Protein of unknown function (DUF2889).